jgi:hypothetical protein
MLVKRGLGFLCFLVLGLLSEAQNYSSISLRYHPGFLIAHRSDVRNMEAHTQGFELHYSWNNFTNEKWSSAYKKPRIGVGLLYMDLGRPDLNGYVFSVIPTFETSIHEKEGSYWAFRVGTGVGYLTRKFDIFENRRNQAIGSHVNGAMQFMLKWNKHFKDFPLFVDAGLGITHFSNGSFRVPNLGVNMPSLVVGLNYKLAEDNGKEKPEKRNELSLSKQEVYLAYAFKERTMSNPLGFNIWNIGYTRMWERKTARKWRAGGDLFFDKTHPYTKELQENIYIDDVDALLRNAKVLDFLEVGIYGGHMWQISRLHVVADVGFYLYKPTRHKYFTYQRIGVKYNFTDRLSTNLALKTHFGIADFFSWGVGYAL